MMKAAILMTVHNRREKTLACLKLCYEQIESLRSEYAFSVYLTDDASTDGTAEAVSREYPDVNIIKGNGSLYWNRGMCAAWNEAAKDAPDFYIWLNDDTILHQGAFAALLENSSYLRHRAILVGTAVDNSGNYSYGGRTKSGKIIPPDPTIPVTCDIFNGNLVLVPKSVYEKLGTMDPFYSHSFGDYDYGVRAAKAGIISAVAPGVLAECDRNPGVPKWRDASYPLKERFKALTGPKGRPPKEQFVYDTRLSNAVVAIIHYVSLLVKVLFPKKNKGVTFTATPSQPLF